MKLIGIAIIFICSAAAGFGYTAMLKQRQKYLDGLIKLVRFIRVQIECFSSPLDIIYADFTDEVLDKCGFTEILKNSGLSTALEQKKETLALTDDTFELLSNFSSELGKSFSDEQVKHCDRYISVLEETASEYAKELPKKCKTVKTLSLSVGAMAALLLI